MLLVRFMDWDTVLSCRKNHLDLKTQTIIQLFLSFKFESPHDYQLDLINTPMKMFKTLLSLPAILLAVGCNSVSYVEPLSGDVSRVRFATKEPSPVVVRAYENAECDGESEWMRIVNHAVIGSSQTRSLGMPLQDFHKNAFKEFNVPAGSEKVVMFFGAQQKGGVIFSCAVPLSLNFLEKNKDYELFFELTRQACTVTASEISNSGGPVRKTLKEYSNNRGDLGDACMAAFKKSRIY